MGAIEWALAADYWRRGAVIISVTFLAITAIPLWLFQMLDPNQLLGANSREAIVLHVTLTLCMGFGGAIAVFQAQGNIKRFFVRPISAARLVIWEMTLGLVTIVLLYTISASILNLGGARWPVLGPALFLAAILACGMAAAWSLEGNVLAQLFGCSGVSFLMFVWFNRRYGGVFMGDWDSMWASPTAAEATTLAAITAGAYLTAIAGVTRVRQGEIWDFAFVWAWWERISSRGRAVNFAGPMQALQWSEWRQKMGNLPACLVGSFLLFVATLQVCGYIPVDEVLAALVAIPIVGLTVIFPMVFGLVLGGCGNSGGAATMRHVLATRPVTDRYLAAALVRNVIWSLLSSWGTWLAGFLVLCGAYALTGYQAELERAMLPPARTLVESLLPLAVLIFISWMFTANIAALAATGRTWMWTTVLFTVFGVTLTFALMKQFIPREPFEQLANCWLAVSGPLYLGGTIWAYIAARQKQLLAPATMAMAGCIWLVISMLVLFLWQQHVLPNFLWTWNGIGLAALGVLPLAAMPLAVRWNRHR